MSATLNIANDAPREVWVVARYEPRKRQRVLLTRENEEKILSSSQYEIVGGELYEKPMPNPRHGRIQARLATEINLFLKTQNIGVIYTETHFQLAPGLIRVPDVAFVSFERFPVNGESDGSSWEIPPDLAIEINSPTDDHENILRKIFEYFASGVRQVWLVEPEFKIITIYFSFTKTAIYSEADEIVCQDILPNFRLSLKDIFQTPRG